MINSAAPWRTGRTSWWPRRGDFWTICKAGRSRLARVDHLVLDEADRMLDMGFLPDIKSIIYQVPAERQTLLFSATLVPEIERIASFALTDPLRIEVARPATVAEGISQVLYPIVNEQKIDLLVTCSATRRCDRSWCSPAPNTARTVWPIGWRRRGTRRKSSIPTAPSGNGPTPWTVSARGNPKSSWPPILPPGGSM
jgi:hypothetical protein